MAAKFYVDVKKYGALAPHVAARISKAFPAVLTAIGPARLSNVSEHQKAAIAGFLDQEGLNQATAAPAPADVANDTGADTEPQGAVVGVPSVTITPEASGDTAVALERVAEELALRTSERDVAIANYKAALDELARVNKLLAETTAYDNTLERKNAELDLENARLAAAVKERDEQIAGLKKAMEPS